MAKEPTSWVIAYISPKQMFSVERDLFKYKRYKAVEAYIPSIKILAKQVKGQKHFQTIPMLFNYGFFKVPNYFIPNSHYLDLMKKDIECLTGWVKDEAVDRRSNPSSGRLYNPLGVAIASKDAIQRIREAEKTQVFYTSDDIKTLYEGKIITLHTYPFEGLPAEIVEISEKQRYVKVKLLLETSSRTVKVGFENIFFSVYKDSYSDDKMKEQYLDDLGHRHKGIENIIEAKHGNRSKGMEDTN